MTYLFNNDVEVINDIGNAVPVEFAKRLAMKIAKDLKDFGDIALKSRASGKVFTFQELAAQEMSA